MSDTFTTNRNREQVDYDGNPFPEPMQSELQKASLGTSYVQFPQNMEYAKAKTRKHSATVAELYRVKRQRDQYKAQLASLSASADYKNTHEHKKHTRKGQRGGR